MSVRRGAPIPGLGMTFNFNHLDEGTYTIRAFADNEQIGQGTPQENTFDVVHLIDFETEDLASFGTNNNDRFLRNLPAVECHVPDFPNTGDTVILEWEESTQNFVISDVQ